jgi:hypothetical protein
MNHQAFGCDDQADMFTQSNRFELARDVGRVKGRDTFESSLIAIIFGVLELRRVFNIKNEIGDWRLQQSYKAYY